MNRIPFPMASHGPYQPQFYNQWWRKFMPQTQTTTHTTPATVPHPQYAVYSRKYPAHILFLLTPATQKLVYTPFCIQLFKFDPERLPTYAEIFKQFDTLRLEDGGDPQLVTLEYAKGRSSEDVLAMIHLQDQYRETMQDLVDLQHASSQ